MPVTDGQAPDIAPSGPADGPAHNKGHVRSSTTALALGAMGVVFGDIGTSPLYALKESFHGPHGLPTDLMHLYGVVSIIFWTMVVIVTVKYVTIILRADNKGEGGSLALLALITRMSGSGRWTASLTMLGVFATALFYGDSIITPAISVLSAVEGLTVVEARLAPLVLPIAVVILVALFMVQSRGTAAMARVFGPIVVTYFLVLAVLGVSQIVQRPEVLFALSPHHMFVMAVSDPLRAFLALGSIVLAITGAEALYADMGHFGRKPIARAWIYVVFPCLMLNYLGQIALLQNDPSAASNPFFLMAPEWSRLPLVILATLATIIASQAMISGAFSVTQQAVQMGFMPRMRIDHTSASAAGQIYVPAVNWALFIAVILTVLLFQKSSNLAAAYGIAVTGTMFITSIMIGVLTIRLWKWPLWAALSLLAVLLLVDGLYLASNLMKVGNGGWLPLLVGAVIFVLLTTWARGRALMRARMAESAMPVEIFTKSATNSAQRVPGTAIFMASNEVGVPSALLHNIKHNKVLHERVVILTVRIADMPFVDATDRVEVKDLGDGFWRLILHFGFQEETDVPRALKKVSMCGKKFEMIDTSFFLSRQTLLPSKHPGMAIWREKLFAWMLRNAANAMEFFKLPTNRVVELGSQVEI